MNGNDMAFPVENRNQTPNDSIQLGLTKRELFAAMIAQGIVTGAAELGEADDSADAHERAIAENAVSIADALIAALNPKGVSK